MKITKHAQSCFLIETEDTKILIDPGTYVFNEEGLRSDAFKDIDTIIVTHEHYDHFDWENVQKIMEASGCSLFGTAAVCGVASQKFPDKTKIIKVKIKNHINNVTIEGFPSKHGGLPSGKSTPGVVGVIINDDKTSFYTPGDSIALNPDAQADVIGTPICGQVVMDIATAKQELLPKKPKLAIAMHYDNPAFPTNPNDFIRAMADTSIEAKVLNWGESVEV